MRLYTLTGATRVDDPEHGSFTADDNGAFEFPNDLSAHLHSHHIDGKPAWETDAERDVRLHAEELERLRDPATLARLLQAALVGAQPAAPAQAPAEAPPAETPAAPVAKAPADAGTPAPKRTPRRSTAAK